MNRNELIAEALNYYNELDSATGSCAVIIKLKLKRLNRLIDSLDN